MTSGVVAEELIGRFLAGRGERTLRAYRIDLDEFADVRGEPLPEAVANLLDAGDRQGNRMVLDYAVELRRRGRAAATIERRLATLHALLGLGRRKGLLDWTVRLPESVEIDRALAELPPCGVPYPVLHHPTEIDRLDLQHYALREVVGGNHLAPVARNATAVLDVGSGTGQWGFEVCEELPRATVVGLDLVVGKPAPSRRFRWVRANVLQGLPFLSGRFDFVHQRLLFLAIPVVDWPAAVSELVRVTRPGGWIELVEPPIGLHGAGPALERLMSLTFSALAPRGLDTVGAVFERLDGYLRDAGLVDVERREVAVRVGPWGGRIGSLLATDFRAGWTRLCQGLQASGALDADDASYLLHQAQGEYEAGQIWTSVALAYGRRPKR